MLIGNREKGSVPDFEFVSNPTTSWGGSPDLEELKKIRRHVMKDFVHRKERGKKEKDFGPKERDTTKVQVTITKFRLDIRASVQSSKTDSNVQALRRLPTSSKGKDVPTHSPLYSSVTGTSNGFWGLPIKVDRETHNLLEYCKYKNTVSVLRTHD